MSVGTGINVGHDKAAVDNVSKTVLAIFREPLAEQETKRAALATLREALTIQNVSISGCYVSGVRDNDK